MADVAKDAAKKFIEEFSGQSGKNLSDFIFEWLTREEEKVADIEVGILVEELEAPDIVVHFDFDKSDIPPSGLNTISDIVSQIRESRLIVVLLGSADRIGAEIYNQQLGKSRAESIERLLKSYGIPDYQIIIGSNR